MKKTRTTRKARLNLSVEGLLGAETHRHTAELAEAVRVASKAFQVAYEKPARSTEGAAGVITISFRSRAVPKFAATVTDWARRRQDAKITLSDSEGAVVPVEIGVIDPAQVVEMLCGAGPHGPGPGPDKFAITLAPAGPHGSGDPDK
jgi:hypothetical protein